MESSASGLLVVGSIALDSLEGGRITDELGGSALYCALAAAPLVPVSVVAAVGTDADLRVRRAFSGRPGIDLTGLAVVDAPTYRWFADAHAGRNIDLGSRDSIYDHWSPVVPSGYRGWAFVGSMRPDRQLDAARQLAGCGLLAADAMRSYLRSAPESARDVLHLADWYFCNDEELAALGGRDPETFRREWDLRGLVLKHGPDGVSAFTAEGSLRLPAGRGPVIDTTGAGDSLAGGMLGGWLRLGGTADALSRALQVGVECARLTISRMGARALYET